MDHNPTADYYTRLIEFIEIKLNEYKTGEKNTEIINLVRARNSAVMRRYRCMLKDDNCYLSEIRGWLL